MTLRELLTLQKPLTRTEEKRVLLAGVELSWSDWTETMIFLKVMVHTLPADRIALYFFDGFLLVLPQTMLKPELHIGVFRVGIRFNKP